jgi:hypothetical protein
MLLIILRFLSFTLKTEAAVSSNILVNTELCVLTPRRPSDVSSIYMYKLQSICHSALPILCACAMLRRVVIFSSHAYIIGKTEAEVCPGYIYIYVCVCVCVCVSVCVYVCIYIYIYIYIYTNIRISTFQYVLLFLLYNTTCVYLTGHHHVYRMLD